jgi:hypothetical protein
MSENQREKNVRNVFDIIFVNDHGKNTQKCFDGKNLCQLNKKIMYKRTDIKV